MVSNLVIAGGVIFFIWLTVLSILFWNMLSHYNKLSQGVGGTLKSALENLLKELTLAKKELGILKDHSAKLEKSGSFHIQKLGLMRFNPFKDTGGDQSFILSLIDGNDTGVIISGLYSRSGTRWYAKKIVNGKSVEYELSDEEKQALKEAQGINT